MLTKFSIDGLYQKQPSRPHITISEQYSAFYISDGYVLMDSIAALCFFSLDVERMIYML